MAIENCDDPSSCGASVNVLMAATIVRRVLAVIVSVKDSPSSELMMEVMFMLIDWSVDCEALLLAREISRVFEAVLIATELLFPVVAVKDSMRSVPEENKMLGNSDDTVGGGELPGFV